MEIARAAAALFVRQGLRATRAEDIAQAAGIAPRTFYRYFASKEEAVAPLYAAGAQRWTQAVREAPASLSVLEALRHAVSETLTPGFGVSASAWEWVRTLIRLADTSPALRKVWAEVCQAEEGALAEILAQRLSTYARQAAAAGEVGEGNSGETRGAGGSGGSDGGEGTRDNVAYPDPDPEPDPDPDPAAPAPVPPRLRFAAAVAGAAIRVAVESWAATTGPPTGAGGPATLALRNLDALTHFTWEEAD
ncbi:TetR/AcrR family transcriptional regulator [Streptomyces collinus]|uniref:TetR/AcrR family transcriptional regulator n=1 Tax=Streptomyces collinus TaxID=42684 RepID=UPI002942D04C|nr:TetR family transcriptional regulator [Streptomyces collinus]